MSPHSEVILPAYTAGSLVVAVGKAGLKPVLCDISLDNYNAAAPDMLRLVGADTLAVVCVHMFGIPVDGIEKLRQGMPAGVFFD